MKKLSTILVLLCLTAAVYAQNTVMTIKEAMTVLEHTVFYETKDQWGTYTYTKFDNPQVVGKIIQKYGYKKVDEYEKFRETMYRPLWYKNTTTPGKDDLSGEITPLKTGIPSIVGISIDKYIEIKVWSRNLYKNLQQQVLAEKFVYVDSDPWGNTNYTSGQYDASLNYNEMTIRISKQY